MTKRRKNHRRRTELFTPSTGNLRQNVNMLAKPTYLPTRRRQAKYEIADGDHSYSIKTAIGKFQLTNVPNAKDARILRAFETRAAINKKGRCEARFDSGQELYDCLNTGKRFNQTEARRVQEALKNWHQVCIGFDGKKSYYERGGHRLPHAFHVLDQVDWGKDKSSGRWWFSVVFNDAYVDAHLHGYTTLLHLPTYLSLKSGLAARLFEWLTARLADQDETRPYDVDQLHAELGAGDSTFRYPSERKRAITDSLKEINGAVRVHNAGNWSYAAKWPADGRVIFKRLVPQPGLASTSVIESGLRRFMWDMGAEAPAAAKGTPEFPWRRGKAVAQRPGDVSVIMDPYADCE